MRVMLATAVFLAGCLHARGPGRSAKEDDAAHLRTFEILVNDADTIDDAEAFAKAKGLERDAVVEIAERAYWSFTRATIYPPAAEIAWRFRFGKRAVALALEAQRGDAKKAVGVYLARKGEDGRTWLYAAIWEMTLEIRIACRYAGKAEALKTVEAARALEGVSGENDVLYPLLDEGCPVEPEVRDAIIDAARFEDRDAYAIRHAAAAKWDWIKTSQFLGGFFLYNECTFGVPALIAFKIEDGPAAAFLQNANCEGENIDSRAWAIPAGTAGTYFFAAVRGMKFNLALELLPFTSSVEDGTIFLYQEALRAGREGELVKALKAHVGYHDGFMAYAWERGRYRFIANFSLTLDWQRKAFDKLVELGRWEDAAEAAQYGASEALRTEGVLIAFRAAMAAGDFKAGRYFLARYGPVKDKPGIITQEMHDAEKDKWYAARLAAPLPDAAPESKPKKKRKRHKAKRPTCADDDWCP